MNRGDRVLSRIEGRGCGCWVDGRLRQLGSGTRLWVALSRARADFVRRLKFDGWDPP